MAAAGSVAGPIAPLLIHGLDMSHCSNQSQSPLFSILPPEIRNHIFYYALLSYEDPERKYPADTVYVRPGYTCHRRTDTALLRTCKLIYHEAWFRPWTSALHTLFFAWDDRRPKFVTTNADIERQLERHRRANIDAEMEHLRIFAQLCNLEDGGRLQNILKLEGFHPKCITVTIRHTDWWNWESDESLYIGSNWVRRCRFPKSLKCLRMELETLKRKKHQVDSIAKQMRASWFFEREDGEILEAREEPTIEEWSGMSAWNGQRWIRDEPRELQLDYYMLTVRWRPVPEAEKGNEKDRARKKPQLASTLRAINPGLRLPGRGCIPWPPPPSASERRRQRRRQGEVGDEFRMAPVD